MSSLLRRTRVLSALWASNSSPGNRPLSSHKTKQSLVMPNILSYTPGAALPATSLPLCRFVLCKSWFRGSQCGSNSSHFMMLNESKSTSVRRNNI